eukprot:gene38650-50761_t
MEFEREHDHRKCTEETFLLFAVDVGDSSYEIVEEVAF